MAVIGVAPIEAKRMLNEDPQIRLVDVRERWEYDTVNIEGSLLLPLSKLQSEIGKLSKQGKYVIVCHHGNRSRRVCAILQSLGFTAVWNLEGGIAQYAVDVDTSLIQY